MVIVEENHAKSGRISRELWKEVTQRCGRKSRRLWKEVTQLHTFSLVEVERFHAVVVEENHAVKMA